jgi:hypothetical protein
MPKQEGGNERKRDMSRRENNLRRMREARLRRQLARKALSGPFGMPSRDGEAVVAQMVGLRRELTWTVEHVPNSQGPLRITCDHLERRHTVFLPMAFDHANTNDAFYLMHEYCHAWLAENVDPIFGAKVVVPSVRGTTVTVDEHELWRARRLLLVADDWFADGLQRSRCPAYFDRYLSDIINELIRREGGGLQDPDLGLPVAEGSLFLRRKLFCGRDADAVAGCLLKVDPRAPSPDALRDLWSALLRALVPRLAFLLDIESLRGDETHDHVALPTGQSLLIPIPRDGEPHDPCAKGISGASQMPVTDHAGV